MRVIQQRRFCNRSKADIKVGIVTSLTGAYSANYTTLEKAVNARFAVENAKGGVDGHKLTAVVADDTSSTAGVLSATQKLIKQDKVYAILDASPVFFAAAAAAKAAEMPVIGASWDGGPEWTDKSYTTFFDTVGYEDYARAATTFGKFFKSQGCTKVGGVGTKGPASGRSAEAAVISAQKVGLQKGYENTQLPVGDTNTGPIVLGIKDSDTDCVFAGTDATTALSMATSLKQNGVNMKLILLPTGYGAALLNDKAAVQAAQGVYFNTAVTPAEANTDATKAMQDALAKYAGEKGDPSFGDLTGWAVADLFVYGLKKAGGDATQSEFVSELRSSTTWDEGGLYAKPTNFAHPPPVASALGPGNCTNIVKLAGDKFVPVDGAVPVCGDIVEGVDITQ